MANDKNFKIKNGLSAGRYLNTNGTETSSSQGFSINAAVYDNISLDVSGEEITPYGLWFKTDGTKLYIVGTSGDAVVEYNLSTAWNVSTASYNQEFSVFSQESSPTGVAFKSDGTKMYVVGVSTDTVYQYALSTAWDVSTASYESKSFSVGSQLTQPMGLYITSNGNKFYTCGYSSDDAVEYTLSTAWDISTASHTNTLDLAADEPTLRGVALNDDGTKFFTVGNTTDTVRQYSLSTAYDLSTASYDNINFNLLASETHPFGIFFKPDGTKFYTTGNLGDSVYQYSAISYTQTLDLSTGDTFSFTPLAATTVVFNNPPASGTAIGFTLEINNTSYALTWPTSIKWHGGTAPAVTSTKEIYAFLTKDGGTTYYGKRAGENIS